MALITKARGFSCWSTAFCLGPSWWLVVAGELWWWLIGEVFADCYLTAAGETCRKQVFLRKCQFIKLEHFCGSLCQRSKWVVQTLGGTWDQRWGKPSGFLWPQSPDAGLIWALVPHSWFFLDEQAVDWSVEGLSHSMLLDLFWFLEASWYWINIRTCTWAFCNLVMHVLSAGLL